MYQVLMENKTIIISSTLSYNTVTKERANIFEYRQLPASLILSSPRTLLAAMKL